MRTEFIRPKLVGRRFDEHSIPLEVLKDWAAFEDLIVETARWLYKEENQGRQRVPKGFSEGFELHLASVEDGSAIAVLDRTHTQQQLIPDGNAIWFEKARDLILKAIEAAGRGAGELLPPHLLSYFDRFGRSLRESERIEFSQGPTGTVSFDSRVRRSLILQAASEYTQEERVRCVVCAVNARAHTMEVEIDDGQRVQGTFRQELLPEAASLLSEYSAGDGPLVVLDCITVRNREESIVRIDKVNRIDRLDPLDVSSRLHQLANLKSGWMDGEGAALHRDGLRWFDELWQAEWPASAPLPYLYPTLDGNLQGEWSDASKAVTAHIDLAMKRAEVLVSNNAAGTEESEHSFDLSNGGLRQLAALIAQAFLTA